MYSFMSSTRWYTLIFVSVYLLTGKYDLTLGSFSEHEALVTGHNLCHSLLCYRSRSLIEFAWNMHLLLCKDCRGGTEKKFVLWSVEYSKLSSPFAARCPLEVRVSWRFCNLCCFWCSEGACFVANWRNRPPLTRGWLIPSLVGQWNLNFVGVCDPGCPCRKHSICMRME